MTTESTIKVSDLLPPLTIETLVNGGHGLARHDGRVVFVPHAAVGDVVLCRVTKVKKTFLEAEICDIVKPALLRRAPPCPVAGICGGCQWQHLPYAEQARAKEDLFRETLTRKCHIDPKKIEPLLPASQEWGYRSRVQIKCAVRNGIFITGFFRPKSHDVVAIEACPLIAPELNTLLSQLRQSFTSSTYINSISQIDLAVDDDKKCSAVIYYTGEESSALAEHLLDTNITADVLLKTQTRQSLTPLVGDGLLAIHVGSPSLLLHYSAGGFAQINLDQNRVLVQKVLDLVGLRGAETVIDLFCGMGNFSLPLARVADKVIGIEGSNLSIKMAKKNKQDNQIENVTFYNRSATGALSFFSKSEQIDLVVLDPPRGGAIEVMTELLDNRVKRVIYISCDPQTLVRDLKILVSGGYELVSSQPLDMFPQTHHCESMTLLELAV